MSLDSIKNNLFLTSFGIGIASTIAMLNPSQGFKYLGAFAVGTSATGVVLSELLTGLCHGEVNAEKAKLELLLKEKEARIRGLDRDYNSLTNRYKQLEPFTKQVQDDLENNRQIVLQRETQIALLKGEINQLEKQLTDVFKFNMAEAHKIVRDTYNRSVKKLEAQVNALFRNHPDCQENLNNVLIEVDAMRGRFSQKIKDYEQLKDFDELLDVGLQLQELIIDKCIDLRVKAQTIVIRHLEVIVKDAVPYSDFETYITDLQNKAGEELHNLHQQREKDVQAIAQEWVVANEGHKEKYNTNFAELLEDAKKAVARLQQIESEVAELRKPLKFFGESTYANAGNAISQYFYNRYGYKLDGINWEETETGYKITYAIRSNPGLSETELYADNSREQLASFTNALKGTLPEFEFNYQNCSVVLYVVLRRAVKKDSSGADIDKIWVPASKFESYVRRWERVRITAGSTGGKSPTAKNLALAIMNSRKGEGEIRLYDPQHNSKKDYWDMPKAGTSHEDNVSGMAELCAELDRRSKTSGEHSFILYVFDEIDSTIAQERENAGYYYFKDKVTYSLKQGSHQNLGAIYIGQACDASTIPGMSWSDWNNAVQLHIGANAGVWLDKAKTIPNEEKTRLLEQYRKIQEYCDRQNEELGLDIFTDATAYRFALAVPLTGLPKFIQLPDFDSYDYYSVMSPQTKDETVVTPKFEEMNSEVSCPYCGSINTKKNGKSKKGEQYHICLDCDQKPKNFVLDLSTNSNWQNIDY